MDKKKLLKLIRIFFILFVLSGISSIINFYFEVFPHMFTGLFEPYEILRFNHLSVKMPGVPLILVLLTIAGFLYLLRRLYKLIDAEIRKEI